MRGRTANDSSSLSHPSASTSKRIVWANGKKTKWESRVSIFTHSNLICDPDFIGRTGMLVARFTWKHSQALDYLTTSGLHGNPVIAHQECKHDQGHKLAGVGLQGRVRKAKCMRYKLFFFLWPDLWRQQLFDNVCRVKLPLDWILLVVTRVLKV